MNCKQCASEKLKDFNGELAIHFPGWEGLEKSPVWVFPELMVCMDCGFVGFNLSASELEQLESDAQTLGRAHARWTIKVL